jgi:hypothetical protein
VPRSETQLLKDFYRAVEVTTHSFRKTVATLIDDDGLSARIAARITWATRKCQ